MIMDVLNQFANSVALPTTGTGIFNVGDVVDLTNLRDIGRGKPPIYLVILVETAITGTASTVSFMLASDSENSLRTDGSEDLQIATAAIPEATLIAGYQIVIPVPPEPPTFQQYLGLQIDVGAAALTAGKISAFLTLDPALYKAFPAAVFA